MSEAMPPPPPFRDRSVRLRLGGLVCALAGVAVAGSGLLVLAVPLLPIEGPKTPWSSAILSAIVHGLLGVGLVRVGVGSYRRRRWVPAAISFVGWTWLIFGLLGLVFGWFMVRALTADFVGEMATAAELVLWSLTAGMLVGGVMVPLLLLWAYRHPDVAATCARHDPTSGPLSERPREVATLGLALYLGAALLPPMALSGVLPLFHLWLEGWTATLVLLAGAAAFAWCAHGVLGQRLAAWWGSQTIFAVTGLSSFVTLQRHSLGELMRRYGADPEQAALLDAVPRTPLSLAVAALTVAMLIYLISIRRHFSAA